MTVIIGIDPHKASHTAVAIDGDDYSLAEIKVRATCQQTEKLSRGAPCFHPSLEVVGGLGTVGDLDHDDAPERAVGLAVTTLVMAKVSGGPAGPGREGRDPAQVGPGGLGAHPFGIVAGRHQQCGGGVGTDAEVGQQVWCRGEQERFELLVELGHFDVQGLDATGQGRERRLGRRRHRIG